MTTIAAAAADDALAAHNAAYTAARDAALDAAYAAADAAYGKDA